MEGVLGISFSVIPFETLFLIALFFLGLHDTLSFFSFLFAVCKDSWEDLTDLVEQMRDDTEGACHTNIFQLFFFLSFLKKFSDHLFIVTHKRECQL